jgi:hypothetical protein
MRDVTPTSTQSTLGRPLRVNNVARALGVAPRTVRQSAADGILPAQKRGPKLWFFYARDLVDLVGPLRPRF